MSDVKCPYCGVEQDIDHDDGYGYEEDEIFEQECSNCLKSFAYTTTISFYHEATEADCLNGSECKFEPTVTFPKECTKMECPDCGARRQPTTEEMKKIMEVNNE